MQERGKAFALLLDIRDDVVVLTHSLRPGFGGIEIMPVGAGHVRDVPDSVSAGSVEQRGTCHGVGELLHTLGAVGERIPR